MKKNEEVEVYICKTDFDYHIPDDKYGIRIFFKKEDIEREQGCTEECGIVKCKLSFVEQCTFGKNKEE
jgi:hypothetical protein